MRLDKVQLLPGQNIMLDCQRCLKSLRSIQGAIYADLDGKPWVDYYHAACLTTEERCPQPNVPTR